MDGLQVYFGFNENTLTEVTIPPVDSKPNAIEISFHKQMIEYWTLYGIMVLSTNDEPKSRVTACLNKMPVQIRKLWKEAFKSNMYKIKYVDEIKDSFPVINSNSDYRALSEVIDVFEISAGDAIKLCIEPSKSFLEKDNIEFVKLVNTQESKLFAAAKRLSTDDIKQEDKVEDVWKYRFSDLAKVSKNITIVDRYAALNFMKRKNCGLSRFIKECSEVTSSTTLTIISSLDADRHELKVNDLMSKFHLLLKKVKDSSFNSINLYLVKDDPFFKGKGHGRFVRFEKLLCDIDIGLEVLEGEKVMKDSTFHLKFAEKKRRSKERDFIKESKRIEKYIKLL